MTRTSAEPTPGPPPADTRDARGRAGLAGLARGGVLSLGGAAVSAAAGVAVVVVVTRGLSRDGAGLFFALTSVFLIAGVVARLGTGTGLVYAISRSRALGRPDRTPALLRVALTPVTVLSIVLGTALWLGAEPLGAALAGGPSAAAADAIRVLGVLLPLTTVSDTLVSATRGFSTIVPTVALERIGRPLLQVGLVALAVGSGSLLLLSAAWALPWAACAVLAGLWLSRLQRGAVVATSPEPQPGPWREFWSFTGPRAVTTVVQLALQRLDIVLLSLLSGPAAAAVYTAATRFLVVGQFVNQALAGVVEPRLSRLLALGDRAAAQATYQAATGWLVLVCWPFYLLVATYAGLFLDLFGDGYDAGLPVVFVLAAVMLVATSIGMVDVVLIMGGRTRWNLGNSLVALAVNVVVDIALIPSLGFVGAAIGWAAAILVNNLLPLFQVWRHLGMHPFGAGTGTAVALALGCFAVLPLLARAAGGEGLGTAAVATALGCAVYAAGCLRWRGRLALDGLRPGIGRRTARPDRSEVS